MYGGTSKLGRGGGPKRMSYPTTTTHRASGPAGRRLSIGGYDGPHGRNTGRATTATPPAVEETFNIVSGHNPLAFAMIIRLAPDLVEEIKRAVAQGGRVRMKFDANPHNPNGNIIDVGGKEFRFTWSREFGDLCDIYEEQQSGEDGNGLLVESGCAWRKLNVQRILDESTKNHLKMRSEEAERKLKSRKAIVLETGNPSMKSQIKALAAVEATSWKNYNKKKESALKKRKVETLQVGGPPKSAYKSVLTSAPACKGRQPSSPVPSPPEQPAVSSPLGALNSNSLDDVVPPQMLVKQDTTNISEKEIPTRTNSALRDTPGGKGKIGAKSMDLQSTLISILINKPSGMTLKALEKAVGDTVSNSVKKIEPIIKRIATYQAPGRYILKPGMDLETFKKPLSESGSSPEDNHHHLPAREDFQDQIPAPQGGYEEEVHNDDLEKQVQLNPKTREISEALEKDDIQHVSPDIYGDRKGSDHSEGQAGSSSDSGSESDSESDSSDSGSGSGSHSRSRSRSPAGTGSGSSSDSESDAPSNSKEASDVDVDIMTSDDEKELKLKTEVSELNPLKTRDGRSMQNDIDDKQDGNESDAVEIENDLPEEQEVERVVPTTTITNRGWKPVEEKKPFSPDNDELREHQNYIGSLFYERENAVTDSTKHDQPDCSERLSKGKHSRGSDVKNFNEKAKHSKKLKTGNFTPAPGPSGMDVQMFESSHSSSPVGLPRDAYKCPTIQMVNKAERQGNPNVGLQKGYNNRAYSGKSNSDLFQSGQRSFDQISHAKLSDPPEKPDKHGESLVRNTKHLERSFHVHEGSSMLKDKSHRDAQNEAVHAAEKKVPRNSREGSNGSKQLGYMDSHYLKQGEIVGKLKEGRQGTHLHIGTSPKDNNRIGGGKSPSINGRGNFIRRELSDLELGELRESTPDVTHVTKQFDRKGSFKRLENKANTSDDRNPDVTKVKPSLQTNLESANKMRNQDDDFEDTRSHSRVMQSHPQHLKADHVETGSQFSRLAEINSRFKNNEAAVGQGIGLDGHGESNRRAPANAPKQHDIKRGTVSHSIKESKRQTSNSVEEMVDGGKDLMFADRNNSDQKRRESSSDENSCSYSKYEKDEAELKGPINTFSQYKEYVQEYRDKYDSYCSLNKILESHRNEFQKLGKDLEYAKGRDMDRYNHILGELKESYRQCGTRHKRLKRIFVVLHEELEQLKQRIKDYANTYNKE